jgi:hypothetical protein
VLSAFLRSTEKVGLAGTASLRVEALLHLRNRERSQHDVVIDTLTSFITQIPSG